MSTTTPYYLAAEPQRAFRRVMPRRPGMAIAPQNTVFPASAPSTATTATVGGSGGLLSSVWNTFIDLVNSWALVSVPFDKTAFQTHRFHIRFGIRDCLCPRDASDEEPQPLPNELLSMIYQDFLFPSSTFSTVLMRGNPPAPHVIETWLHSRAFIGTQFTNNGSQDLSRALATNFKSARSALHNLLVDSTSSPFDIFQNLDLCPSIHHVSIPLDILAAFILPNTPHSLQLAPTFLPIYPLAQDHTGMQRSPHALRNRTPPVLTVVDDLSLIHNQQFWNEVSNAHSMQTHLRELIVARKALPTALHLHNLQSLTHLALPMLSYTPQDEAAAFLNPQLGRPKLRKVLLAFLPLLPPSIIQVVFLTPSEACLDRDAGRRARDSMEHILSHEVLLFHLFDDPRFCTLPYVDPVLNGRKFVQQWEVWNRGLSLWERAEGHMRKQLQSYFVKDTVVLHDLIRGLNGTARHLIPLDLPHIRQQFDSIHFDASVNLDDAVELVQIIQPRKVVCTNTLFTRLFSYHPLAASGSARPPPARLVEVEVTDRTEGSRGFWPVQTSPHSTRQITHLTLTEDLFRKLSIVPAFPNLTHLAVSSSLQSFTPVVEVWNLSSVSLQKVVVIVDSIQNVDDWGLSAVGIPVYLVTFEEIRSLNSIWDTVNAVGRRSTRHPLE